MERGCSQKCRLSDQPQGFTRRGWIGGERFTGRDMINEHMGDEFMPWKVDGLYDMNVNDCGFV